MSFYEKNKENLETLVFSLTNREKTTIVIAIYDCDDTYEKAVAFISQQFTEHKTYFFDLFGQKINSLLAFFRENLPKNGDKDLPIVHIKRMDPLLFVSENHKVVSSPLVAQINMERELLFHEVEALAVVWLTRAGYNRLRMDAPDFMDWVVSSFTFESDGLVDQKLSVDIPKETIEDRSNAAILQLKEKAEKLQYRTVKFAQATKLSTKDKKEFFNLLLALIAAYIGLHDLDKAQSTLEQAYTLAKDNNLANGYEFGQLLLDRGDNETQLGNLAAALLLFEEALAFSKQLGNYHNIGVCLERLGNTHRSLGNLDKALGFYEGYNKLEKELYFAYPTNVDIKNGLAISYEKLGSTQASLGNLDKALGFYEEYNKLENELYVAYPMNVSFKNGLAISYQNLGATHSSLDNLDKALVFFEEYNKLEKELYFAYPTNVSFKNNLASSYAHLGIFSKNNFKDTTKARTYLQQAEALWQELVRDTPQNVNYQAFLGVVQKELEDL